MFVFVLLNNQWNSLDFCGRMRTNKVKQNLILMAEIF